MYGIVQGVGFRPFVHRLATAIGIHGHVRNAGGHVVIAASGSPARLEAFVSGLRTQGPEVARVRDVVVTPGMSEREVTDFQIVESAAARRRWRGGARWRGGRARTRRAADPAR
nr:acylphosphatase [Nonomuraea basaltis]